MNLKKITDYAPSFYRAKTVLVRVDYNTPLEKKDGQWRVADDSRIRSSMTTLKFLLNAQAKIVLLSHLGRPQGKRIMALSLKPVAQKLNELAFGLIGYKKKVLFSDGTTNRATRNKVRDLMGGQIILLENLRFWCEEKENNIFFAKRLAKLGEIYVNDAFSVSHRRHASVVALPRQFSQRLAGEAFYQEVKELQQLRRQPIRPVALVLGGVKEDKINDAFQMQDWFDWLLIGGKLGKAAKGKHQKTAEKIMIAELRRDGQDISEKTMTQFSEKIKGAGTVIFAGPQGNIEKGFLAGTKALVEAAVKANVFSVAGGGDTERALTQLGLIDSINYIASGGGAMLAFLAEGTSPGIEALK